MTEVKGRFRIPSALVCSERVIKDSAFICTVTHAPTEGAARESIEKIAAKYSDASHNAWAYRISEAPREVFASSDDGEPGGTAGRPMLAVLQGSGLQEVVAVVSRYFGGTKLGTGGLVRAYGDAVREALKALPTEERVLHKVARIVTDYGLYNDLRHLLPRYDVTVQEETFAERVTMTIAVPYDRTEMVDAFLRDVTGGRLALQDTWIGETYL
ncbi:MAG: YigZ family protein [Chloroflexota bacterium]|nr:YigZ family protein [Chloroflexota bacterium]